MMLWITIALLWLLFMCFAVAFGSFLDRKERQHEQMYRDRFLARRSEEDRVKIHS